MQEGIDFTQIEMVALEEVGFLLSKKPRCPLLNLVRDDIFAPVKKPPGCALQKKFGDGISALVYKHWIQMFGQNQGMGRRFIIPTLSSYPFCKKISGRWDELLKPHY